MILSSRIVRRFATVATGGGTTATTTMTKESLWSKAKTIPVKYPFAFGVILSGFKTSFSDLLVQKVVERKGNFSLWKAIDGSNYALLFTGRHELTQLFLADESINLLRVFKICKRKCGLET
jgi:hypothetical protein